MSGLLNCNILTLTMMSMVLLLVFSQEEQQREDGLCPLTTGVLCVKHVLLIIDRASKEVKEISSKIEKKIFKRQSSAVSLKKHVKLIAHQMRSNFPTSKYHEQFYRVNNMDKKYLGDLSLEAHYAMSFYYNSIEDLLNTYDVFTPTIDASFKKLQLKLRDGIICKYRSILDVYSHEWPLIHQIKRIQFPPRTYQNASSLDRDIHSIIILQSLSEWMQTLHNVAINVEAKFY